MHMRPSRAKFQLPSLDTTLLGRRSLFQETFGLRLPGFNHIMEDTPDTLQRSYFCTRTLALVPFFDEVEAGSRLSQETGHAPRDDTGSAYI